MERKHNPNLTPFAQKLRREMTKQERHLWYDFLCTYPVKFTRQKVLGRYIVDFYCAEAQLAVELDGSQHFEDDAMKHDAERTAYLEQYGLRVFRVDNSQIAKNFRGVCETIDAIVREALASPD